MAYSQHIERLKKAVAYIRVSSDKIEQEKSLENQKQQFLQFIKKEGYEYHDIYLDVETGTNADRENLMRMLKDAEAGKFDMIVAKELTRIARNVELSYRIKRLAENKDIRIYTLDGKVDSHDPKSMAMFGLHAWMAESEAQQTSERIKAMMITNMKQAKFMGSTPPYGYVKGGEDGKTLVVKSEETTEIVKRIFQLTLEGKAQDTIAKILIAEEVRTPSQELGKKNAGIYWHGTTVRKILENEAYIGNLVQHKESSISAVNHKRKEIPKEQQIRHENTHEAIIDEATFYRVQELIKVKNRRGKYGTRPVKRLFTQRIYCADCGGTMWYRKNIKGYICGTNEKKGKTVCDCNHSIKEKAIEEAILADINTFSKNFDYKKIENALKKEAEKLLGNTKSTTVKLEEKIKKNRIKHDRLLDMELEGRLTKDEYDEKSAGLREEYIELSNQLKEIKADTKGNSKAFDIKKTKQYIDQYINATKVDQKLVTALVERIEINADKTFKINYAFAPLNN